MTSKFYGAAPAAPVQNKRERFRSLSNLYSYVPFVVRISQVMRRVVSAYQPKKRHTPGAGMEIWVTMADLMQPLCLVGKFLELHP